MQFPPWPQNFAEVAKLENAQDLKSCGCITLAGAIPALGTDMNTVLKRNLNQNFFKEWTEKMSYVLGFIMADGCITVSKERPNRPFTLNITSADKKHLYKLRKALKSEHKISRKPGGGLNTFAYQLQIRNPIITNDLMKLGIFPRKTSHLNPIIVPEKYFPDFVRGFFDGDGSVYIYKVNKVPQIKANFVSSSLSFIVDFNQNLCEKLNIPLKSIHKETSRRKTPLYYVDFYIEDCEKLAEFIYGNNPILFLPRKRKVFEKWKSIKRRDYLKQNYPSKIGWHLNQKIVA